MNMIDRIEYLRKRYACHSISKKQSEIDKLINEISVIPISTDKQIVKIHEGKSVIIQFDSLLKKETIDLIKEDIQNQIKENGFAVVDGGCKIVEFDNPKYLIETK